MRSSQSDQTDESSSEDLKKLVVLSKLTDVGSWSDITILNLTNCGLSALPTNFDTAFPNLSILFLSNNNFREMPPIIGSCPNLQMVAFKSNQMESIHPDALQEQLRWLILTDNLLTELPETIGRCTRLQKCMLSGNQLQQLPASMVHCSSLELIRLASNRLEETPTVLWGLPRLAWIALSDNPFLVEAVKSNTLSSIADSLPILEDINEQVEAAGEVLGEGAGGITRKVMRNNEYVAVKAAGKAITSDGLPEEERRISCAASTLKNPACPALLQVLGQTPKGSLVLEYLEGYQTLAGPPSFETCSRDVYGENCKVWTTEQAEMLLSRLLKALEALHNVGICHGDLYAHNILVKEQQDVRLSDFGAAFFYNRTLDQELEKIELRAMAILVEEVNEKLLLDGPLPQFTELAQQCRTKPCFSDVDIWFSQQKLKEMAKAFGEGIQEEKEPS